MPHSQGLSNKSILSRINPIIRIDTYLFKVHSNIDLPSSLGLPNGLFPVGLPVKILKTLPPSSIMATCPAHLNLLDLIPLPILGESPEWTLKRKVSMRVIGLARLRIDLLESPCECGVEPPGSTSHVVS